MTSPTIAFAGPRRLAAGALNETAAAVARARDLGEDAPLLIFDAVTSEPVEVEAGDAAARSSRGRGRPKLGVTAREVTLLPRHWDWLSRQSGGASAALRRLTEAARRGDAATENLRAGRESLYRFLTVMVGDAPGYEEAIRALFGGDRTAFEARASAWPDDIRDHAAALAEAAFPPAPPSLDRLPADRCAAVSRALATAFPGAPLEAIAPLASGASGATVYALTIGGGEWVLRLDGPSDAYRDPRRQYACMAIAQTVGVAPLLIHADASDRLSITRRVTARPAIPALDRTRMLVSLGAVVRRLHDGPLFPARRDYFTELGDIVADFAAGPSVAPALGAALRCRLASLVADCGDHGERVSSHNDLNPGNVIFDGDRPWIVDWEASSAADPYVDVAAVANWFAADEAEARVVLDAYLGTAPGPAERRRFALMRRMNRLFYGVMLLRAAGREPAPVTEMDVEAAPRVAAIRPRMTEIATDAGRRLFGLAFLADALAVGDEGG